MKVHSESLHFILGANGVDAFLSYLPQEINVPESCVSKKYKHLINFRREFKLKDLKTNASLYERIKYLFGVCSRNKIEMNYY